MTFLLDLALAFLRAVLLLLLAIITVILTGLLA